MAWIGLAVFYFPLCYFALYQEWGLDFASYYASSHLIVHGGMPYSGMLSLNHSSQQWTLPGNPNPPITLALFSVFSYFTYPVAFMLWLMFSTLLGAVGVYKTLQIVCPRVLQENEMALWMLFYSAAYPIMMNTIMLQFGGCLLFFLMMGYAASLAQKERQAGFWWGALIAFKLFPILLVGYACGKKRFRLVGWILLWAALFTLLPMLFLGKALYLDYGEAITRKIFWYGANWNLSILGFLYRIFVPVALNPATKAYGPIHDTSTIHIVYLTLVVMALMGWMYKFRWLEKIKHRNFAVMMLLMMLLSPLGWLYYFPMLLVPLLCTLNDALIRMPCSSNPLSFSFSPRLIFWFASVFCFYLPMPVVHVIMMTNLTGRVGLYSIQFYGLLILVYLTLTMTRSPDQFTINKIPQGVKQGMIALTCFSLLFVLLRCGIFVLKYTFKVGA